MSEKQIPKHAPYTAQELVDTGWVARVRAAILADGNAVRVGNLCIEAQTPNRPDDWRPIMLPNCGQSLVSLDECAKVVDMLKGKTPIPPHTLE